MKKHILIVYSLSILLSCASSEEALKSGQTEPESSRSDCISQGSIRDYTVLDDSNLLVSERPQRNFHVVLSRRAYALQTTRGLGFDSPIGRICSGFSDIITNDGFTTEKIRIQSVRRVTAEEVEQLLVRFGKKEPEFQQPRQPEEIEGAEVEELD